MTSDDTVSMTLLRCLSATIRIRRLALGAGLGAGLGAVLLLSGCNDSWARDRDAALLALERGDDAAALSDAQRIVSSGPRAMKPEAAYIGGIAAYRDGRFGTALELLREAERSDDPDLRGRALIQSGTVQIALGRPREAAASFERGGGLLEGRIAGAALVQAADAYKSLGLEADASRCLARARRAGGSDVASGRIAGYTIQFGAFSTRANAEKCVRQVGSSSRRAGLGMPELVEQAGLYKVQVGTYPDLAVAGRAIDRVKRTAEVLPTIVAIGD